MGDTTVGQLIEDCAAKLGDIPGARDESREIVAAILDVTKSWPSMNSAKRVCQRHAKQALDASVKRATGAPIQYAIGRAPFRHLSLVVDGRVLIPRPETEMLVDIVLSRVKGGTIADVGTGSGAIALALATEGAYDRVIATDISGPALDVARDNGARYEAQGRGVVEFRSGSLLAPLAGETLAALVSNPPYIADAEMDELPAEVRGWEPEGALRSGTDGLEATRAIIAGAPDVLVPGGLLALEVDSRRAACTSDILKADGRYEKIEITADLTGRERFVTALRR
ncbi:MAG: peptide chain release factor N(5)-glutamine methyltransferase [Gemmatimonadota bacterium]|nr:peptide chain release factor N(5)-glutamine methyltransferase [Gemmatimonadota bacterium]